MDARLMGAENGAQHGCDNSAVRDDKNSPRIMFAENIMKCRDYPRLEGSIPLVEIAYAEDVAADGVRRMGELRHYGPDLKIHFAEIFPELNRHA